MDLIIARHRLSLKSLLGEATYFLASSWVCEAAFAREAVKADFLGEVGLL